MPGGRHRYFKVGLHRKEKQQGAVHRVRQDFLWGRGTDGPLMRFVMYCHQLKIGDLFVLNNYKDNFIYIEMLGFSKEID